MLKDEYKIYEEKMSKSIDSPLRILHLSGLAGPTPLCWTALRWTITARRRPFSRSPRFPRRTPVFCKSLLGIIPR